jgi:hypothetical protein
MVSLEPPATSSKEQIENHDQKDEADSAAPIVA